MQPWVARDAVRVSNIGLELARMQAAFKYQVRLSWYQVSSMRFPLQILLTSVSKLCHLFYLDPLPLCLSAVFRRGFIFPYAFLFRILSLCLGVLRCQSCRSVSLCWVQERGCVIFNVITDFFSLPHRFLLAVPILCCCSLSLPQITDLIYLH